MVSNRAILDRLRQLSEAGIDLDRIPLSLTVSDLIRMPVVEIAELAQNATG